MNKPTLPAGWTWGTGRYQHRAQYGPRPHRGMGHWDPKTGAWTTEEGLTLILGAPWDPETAARVAAHRAEAEARREQAARSREEDVRQNALAGSEPDLGDTQGGGHWE